ncbi:lasso peptide biosynthesis B2 protein [Colwellia sp. TT2012]|uniref:lasso peptide biosynthesis B2 protein n=1 Tax=Colwellia sp. TT2012 TaxID=1720342 RepID=UPI00070A6392|nr:lasso peptide biosynthesis B2 protein [Colwellia sp. TT2012]
MASLAKLGKFTLKELGLLLEAWFTFVKWDLLISFTEYDNWRNQISLSANSNDANVNLSDATQVKQIKLIIKLSEISARFQLRKMNCLRRCISQQQILKKRGFSAQMHIGVRFEKEKLLAHVWLTVQGKIINDSEAVTSRYSELKVNNEQVILNTLK